MRSNLIASAALLIAAACSGGVETTAPAGDAAGSADQAAVAANSRPDGSATNAAKPNQHLTGNGHPGAMDMATMTPQAGDPAATRGYKQAMLRMMQAMPPYTNDADVDFAKQMRIHHLAAIDMAEVHLANGKDEANKALSRKIIDEQKREIAQLEAWLRQRGQ